MPAKRPRPATFDSGPDENVRGSVHSRLGPKKPRRNAKRKKNVSEGLKGSFVVGGASASGDARNLINGQRSRRYPAFPPGASADFEDDESFGRYPGVGNGLIEVENGHDNGGANGLHVSSPAAIPTRRFPHHDLRHVVMKKRQDAQDLRNILLRKHAGQRPSSPDGDSLLTPPMHGSLQRPLEPFQITFLSSPDRVAEGRQDSGLVPPRISASLNSRLSARIVHTAQDIPRRLPSAITEGPISPSSHHPLQQRRHSREAASPALSPPSSPSALAVLRAPSVRSRLSDQRRPSSSRRYDVERRSPSLSLHLQRRSNRDEERSSPRERERRQPSPFQRQPSSRRRSPSRVALDRRWEMEKERWQRRRRSPSTHRRPRGDSPRERGVGRDRERSLNRRSPSARPYSVRRRSRSRSPLLPHRRQGGRNYGHDSPRPRRTSRGAPLRRSPSPLPRRRGSLVERDRSRSPLRRRVRPSYTARNGRRPSLTPSPPPSPSRNVGKQERKTSPSVDESFHSGDSYYDNFELGSDYEDGPHGHLEGGGEAVVDGYVLLEGAPLPPLLPSRYVAPSVSGEVLLHPSNSGRRHSGAAPAVLHSAGRRMEDVPTESSKGVSTPQPVSQAPAPSGGVPPHLSVMKSTGQAATANGHNEVPLRSHHSSRSTLVVIPVQTEAVGESSTTAPSSSGREAALLGQPLPVVSATSPSPSRAPISFRRTERRSARTATDGDIDARVTSAAAGLGWTLSPIIRTVSSYAGRVFMEETRSEDPRWQAYHPDAQSALTNAVVAQTLKEEATEGETLHLGETSLQVKGEEMEGVKREGVH